MQQVHGPGGRAHASVRCEESDLLHKDSGSFHCCSIVLCSAQLHREVHGGKQKGKKIVHVRSEA